MLHILQSVIIYAIFILYYIMMQKLCVKKCTLTHSLHRNYEGK